MIVWQTCNDCDVCIHVRWHSRPFLFLPPKRVPQKARKSGPTSVKAHCLPSPLLASILLPNMAPLLGAGRWRAVAIMTVKCFFPGKACKQHGAMANIECQYWNSCRIACHRPVGVRSYLKCTGSLPLRETRLIETRGFASRGLAGVVRAPATCSVRDWLWFSWRFCIVCFLELCVW